MALIKCPECGNMISDRAEKCPHCGLPSAYFFASPEKKDAAGLEEIDYKEDRASRLSYLRKARSICRLVITNKNRLGTAKGFASQLERDLLPYGEY